MLKICSFESKNPGDVPPGLKMEGESYLIASSFLISCRLSRSRFLPQLSEAAASSGVQEKRPIARPSGVGT